MIEPKGWTRFKERFLGFDFRASLRFIGLRVWTSISCAILLHVGPIILRKNVDPLFQVEAFGWVILAALCLLHTALLNLPGRIGTWIGLTSLVAASLFTFPNILNIRLLKGPLSFMTLATVIQSNHRETYEFFENYGDIIWTTGVFCGVCILSLISLYFTTRPINSWRIPSFIVAGSIPFVTLILWRALEDPKRAMWEIHEFAYVDRFFSCLLRYDEVLESKANAQNFWNKRSETRQRLHLTSDIQALRFPLVIVVIGESTTRRHMGIYGYKRQTTPVMHELRDRLVFFSDAISPVAYTLPAVLGALCAESFDINTLHCNGPNLLEVAASVDYKTSWISNQAPTGFGENVLVELGETADFTDFVNRNVTTGGESDRNTNLDEKVLPAFRARLDEFHVDSKPQMVFIHLMGTHFTYEKRYPKNGSQFFHPAKADWLKNLTKVTDSEVIIKHYDNAIAYQDSVLGEIFRGIKPMQQNAIFFYFSDHGEEVYDSDQFFGHSEDRLTPAMREIPFVVGYSDDVQSNAPDLVKRIRMARERPFSTLQLTVSIMDLLGLSYQGMPRHESIFSARFVERPRMTYSGPYVSRPH